MTIRSRLLPLAALSLGLASAALAQDNMGRGDGMSKPADSKMTSPMSKDQMGKETSPMAPTTGQSGTGMTKDGMSDKKTDGMSDGMKK